MLARKGMTKVEVWWSCGWPDYTLDAFPGDWFYDVDVPTAQVLVQFREGEAWGAYYYLIPDTPVQVTPEFVPLPYQPVSGKP
jgi:hypothetical protein